MNVDVLNTITKISWYFSIHFVSKIMKCYIEGM